LAITKVEFHGNPYTILLQNKRFAGKKQIKVTKLEKSGLETEARPVRKAAEKKQDQFVSPLDFG
jgi:hypothetical protein